MTIVIIFFKTARNSPRLQNNPNEVHRPKRFPKSKLLGKKSAHFHMQYKIYWKNKQTRHQGKRFGHMWHFSMPTNSSNCFFLPDRTSLSRFLKKSRAFLLASVRRRVRLIVYRYLWVCILFSRSLPLSMCSWHLTCTLLNERLRYFLVCITIKNGNKSVCMNVYHKVLSFRSDRDCVSVSW